MSNQDDDFEYLICNVGYSDEQIADFAEGLLADGSAISFAQAWAMAQIILDPKLRQCVKYAMLEMLKQKWPEYESGHLTQADFAQCATRAQQYHHTQILRDYPAEGNA